MRSRAHPGSGLSLGSGSLAHLSRLFCAGVAMLTGNCSKPSPGDSYFSLELQRTRCLGTCPVYAVQVDSKGGVSFEGLAFIHLRGHQQWQIPPTAIAAISRDIEDRRILDLTQAQLDSACRGDVFDAPTTTLKLTRNRQHVTLTDKSAKRMSATKRRRRFTAPGKSLGDQNSQCRHHPENVMARNSRSDGSAYAPPTLA